MNVNTARATPDTVAQMQRAYLSSLTGPQDAYWQEGLIAASDHYEIQLGGNTAGYFVLDSRNRMMQFHLKVKRDAPTVFRQVLDAHQVESAFAATIEPFYFSLCLDLQQTAKVHTYLFSHDGNRESNGTGPGGYDFRPATSDDLKRVLPLFTGGDEFVDLETVAAHFAGPLGYAKMVIEAGILQILEKNGKVLGTGEFRERKNWIPYADVGVIVSKKHRRQGIGTHVLTLLKQKAVRQGLIPICSCAAGNVASFKAIQNAGFIPGHRVVQFSF